MNVVRVENAEMRVLLDLEKDLKQRFFREKEEPESRRFRRRRQRRRDADGGDADGGVAGGGEAELFKEDHGASVIEDFEGLDLGGGGTEEEGKGEEVKEE